jgi:hypothetical protein
MSTLSAVRTVERCCHAVRRADSGAPLSIEQTAAKTPDAPARDEARRIGAVRAGGREQLAASGRR